MKKIFVLASVAFLALVTNETQAKDVLNCKAGQQSCGTNCCWSVEGTTLKITGGADGSIGKMGNYDYSKISNGEYQYLTTAPWKDSGVTSVDVQGVKNIGDFAFMGLGLTEANISDTVTNIGTDSFHSNALRGIDLSDNITTIGFGSFTGAFYSGYRISKIPDSVKYLGAQNGIYPTVLPDTIEYIGKKSLKNADKLICLGNKESCNTLKLLLSHYCPHDTCKENNYIDLSGKMVLAGYAECASTNYFWNGAECVREPDVTKRKCCSSCKDVGGYCNRIRYTPAEAAKVLRDDNTNEVTITFKK